MKATKFLIVLLLSVSCIHKVHADEHPSYIGCYFRKDVLTQYSETEPPTYSAVSYIGFRSISGKENEMQFNLFIHGYNYHECGATGVVDIKNGALSVKPANSQCVMRILFEGDKIVLKDELERCKDYFGCGAHANVDGMKFPIASKRNAEDCWNEQAYYSNFWDNKVIEPSDKSPAH